MLNNKESSNIINAFLAQMSFLPSSGTQNKTIYSLEELDNMERGTLTELTDTGSLRKLEKLPFSQNTSASACGGDVSRSGKTLVLLDAIPVESGSQHCTA